MRSMGFWEIKMIKILIVEDQALLRDTLQHLINGQSDMEVVNTTDDASKAPDICRKLKPDLVLMDVVTANDSNGIIFAEQIHRDMPGIKTIIMTALPAITFIDEARKAGVDSFIYKNSGQKHLFYVIRSTMEGIGVYPGPRDSPSLSGRFTETEISVIQLVCQGKIREEIIKELGITEFALRAVITSVLDKTGFDSITKFALYALSRDLIVIPN